MEQQKKTRIIYTAIAVGIVAVFTALLLGLYFGLWAPKPEPGPKTVTVEITIDGKTTSFTGTTKADYLYDYMVEAATDKKLTFDASMGEYGPYITGVNGRTAQILENGDSEFFALYYRAPDGENQMSEYGVGSLVLKDGYTYSFILEVYKAPLS